MKLVLIGGCRNAEDEKRVRDLKDLCGHMSVEDNVEFKVLPPQPRSAGSVSSQSFFFHEPQIFILLADQHSV